MVRTCLAGLSEQVAKKVLTEEVSPVLLAMVEPPFLSWRCLGEDVRMYDHGNLRGTPQCPPPQEIAGLIKGLLTTIIP